MIKTAGDRVFHKAFTSSF